ncbi:MAG TPA: PEP-CTERM sorting domain-containing protein, partial [Pirellulales bacterium]
KIGEFVVVSGDGSALSDTFPASYNANGSNLLQLSCDPTNNTTSASINGVSVLTNGSLGAFVPDIDSAGFHFFRPTGAEIDNFAVVPEPSTLVLILIGMASFGFKISRRRATP